MAYEPHHNPTYESWKDLPDKTTPAMASTFQGYDNIIKDIEAELVKIDSNSAVYGASVGAYLDESNALNINLYNAEGEQRSSTSVSGIATEQMLSNKVDKETGKGLFSGNYDDLQNRLIPDGTSITKDEDGTIHATGGGEGTGVVDITQADYDALTDEEKQDGTVYNITDAPEVVSDEYAVGRQYMAGDYCIYKNGLYRCLADTTGEWDASAWELTSLVEEIKTNGSNLQSLEDRLTSAAFAQVIGDSAEMMANTESGYLADALAIKGALNDFREGAVEYQHCSDLNNVPKTGPYQSNGTNAPKGVQSHVYAFKWTDNLEFQIGIPLSEKRVYSRIKCNGPWTDWTPAGSYLDGNLDFEWLKKADGYDYLRFTIQGNSVIEIPFGITMEPKKALMFSSVDSSKYSASLITISGGIFIMELNCSLTGTYLAWQEIPVGQFASYDLGEQTSLGVAVCCSNNPITLRVDIKANGTVTLNPYEDLSLPGGTIFYGRFVRVYK